MFTKEEKDVLKELVSLEIDEVKSFLNEASEFDKVDLRRHLDLLEEILNKLK